jgi:hypothetical protein
MHPISLWLNSDSNLVPNGTVDASYQPAAQFPIRISSRVGGWMHPISLWLNSDSNLVPNGTVDAEPAAVAAGDCVTMSRSAPKGRWIDAAMI